MAVASPWVDITQSLPSWETNWRFDYLPRPSEDKKTPIPPDSIWPATPPRKNLYVDDAFLAHPLAALVVNRSWSGAPPVFLSSGWELLADEIKFLARKLDGDGVPVVFEEYEGMPHTFALVLPSLPGARKSYDSWAGFINAVTKQPAVAIESKAVRVLAKTLEEVPLELSELSPMSLDEVRESVGKRVASTAVPPARL